MAEKTIQSIDKAIEILNYIADNGSTARLTQISEDLEINKSTLFGILKTLEAKNMIHKDENANYALGINIKNLGLKQQLLEEITALACPYLNNLYSKFNETVFLAIFSDNQVKYIKVISSQSCRKKKGFQSVLHATACGKLYLSSLENKDLELFLNEENLQSRTNFTITNVKEIYDQIQDIKNNEVAVQIQEYESGYLSCASPIYKNKEMVAAIGFFGPTSKINYETLEAIKSELKKASALISKSET